MGSCQSSPKDVAVSPSPTKEVMKPRTASTTELTFDNNPSAILNNAVLKESLQDSRNAERHHEETECDTTAESSTRTESPSSPKKPPHHVETAPSSGRVPLSKVRPGYSSGGSSVYETEDEPEQNQSTHSHLKDWKNELSADGDLCKGVVRIETDFGRPIDEIYEGVHDGLVLGSGVVGIVRRVTHRKTGVNYAVKCLDLGLIGDPKVLKALRDEIFIMCQLDHPNIVRLEEVYESENEIYLIMELCVGGDLFDRLDEQVDFHYSETKCAKLVKQMLSSIRYLHSKNIIHRDLKLENFLFSSPNPDSELKMIDFGLSKHFTFAGEIQHEFVGTPYTVAPETIRAEYDEKIDIWALGVITYLLLCGETPFGGADGENPVCVRNNILRGQCVFEPAELWGHVSDAGKVFVKRILEPKTSKRPTAKEAQLDPWLQTYGKRDAEADANLSPKLAQALIEFKEYSDMRKVLCEVLSFTLLPEQIVDLRKEFEKVDPEGEGEISLAALKQVLVDTAEAGDLGALNENEVEDIFDALRVRKSETKIRWHEFIAAGLSQCNFDERNLKLAFDRLDYDRKGYINCDDMKELLGTSGGEKDESIQQMWQDGMTECACPFGRITYDDFRMFVKGQKKEREPGTPRRKSLRVSLEGSPLLQAVPEGTTSPQAKHQVFARFDELSALDSLKMPLLGGISVPEVERKPKEVDIAMPLEPCHRRGRSRSLGETPISISEYEEEADDENIGYRRNLLVGLPSIAIRKHREFRQSVLGASKVFDQKRQARKLDFTAMAPPRRQGNANRRASLVMRRGSIPKAEEYSPSSLRHISKEITTPAPAEQLQISNQSDHSGERKSRMEDATKRSGRPQRRRRQKTTSDISGMLR